MDSATRHARKYWKRYLLASGLYCFATRALIKRYRDKVITRKLCIQVSNRGKESHAATSNVKKAYVFLNPTANSSDARSKFVKFAAPILNLAEFEVIVVESEYRGQIQVLMGYIDPRTDIVVAAGGDGTLFEVVNGLMRRHDVESFMHSVRIGVIPLGKENNFYSHHFPTQRNMLLARRIGEAAQTVVKGDTKLMADLMLLCPSEGNRLYALHHASWGVFKDAYNSRDRFWLFGPLRTLASHINRAIRYWPLDHKLELRSAREQTSVEQHQSLDILGFDLKLNSQYSSLLLNIWPTAVKKREFIKHGWFIGRGRTSSLRPFTMPQHSCHITPRSSEDKESWFAIDGEQYEAMAVEASVMPNCLNIITRQLCERN